MEALTRILVCVTLAWCLNGGSWMCTKVSLELLGPVEAIVKISTLDVA